MEAEIIAHYIKEGYLALLTIAMCSILSLLLQIGNLLKNMFSSFLKGL